MLTIKKLCELSNQRDRECFPECSDWTLADWMTALAGEVGEAANIIKKIKRDGWTPKLQVALGKEIADIQLYLPLLARAAHIDLEQETINKFEETSIRFGSNLRLKD